MPSADPDHLGTDLLSLPYRDRQLIAIVEQAANPIEHVEVNLSDYVPALNKTFWTKQSLTETLKKSFTKKHWTNALDQKVWGDAKNWGLYGYAFEKLRRMQKPSTGGSMRHLRTIQADIAEGSFSFPPGHPLYDTAYAGHPLRPSVYVPLATFHRILFEEKVNEFLTLLWCLRAVRVTIHYVRGYRDAFEASGGLAVPAELPVDVRASVERTTSRRSEATLEAQFTPVADAHIPSSLVWYAHEPTWQKVAEARLSAGLRTIDFELRYDDDFGIGGEIATMLTGIGLRLGGDFQKHERTVWKFQGSFG
jgi:hypothetical protein